MEWASEQLESKIIYKGLTATAGGFYGPQGRVLRLPLQDSNLNNKIDTFNYNGLRVTNLEMETSMGLSWSSRTHPNEKKRWMC